MDVAVDHIPGGGVGDRHRNILCPAHPVLREVRREPHGALPVGRVEVPPPIRVARLGVTDALGGLAEQPGSAGLRRPGSGMGAGVERMPGRGLRGGGVAWSPLDLGDVLINRPVAIEGGVSDLMVGESIVQPSPVEVQPAALVVQPCVRLRARGVQRLPRRLEAAIGQLQINRCATTSTQRPQPDTRTA